MSVKIKFQHSKAWASNLDIPDFDPINDYRVSRQGMGGYYFPLLDELSDFEVTIYSVPNNIPDFRELCGIIKSETTQLAHVDTTKLVVVSSSQNVLQQLGLKIWTTEYNSKTVKRAKTLVRPFRIHAKADQLTVKVVEGGKELDGAGVVNQHLFLRGIMNVNLGYWNPVQRATIVRWLERQRIHNSRFVGNLVDYETGEPLNAFGKGNFIVADLGEDGPDIITTWDNLKHEITGDGPAWALFEPQSAKDAWEDRQTFINQSFLMSLPEARERMRNSRHKAMDDLTKGRLMSNVVDLARAEFHKEFAWDDERFFREIRWNANALALHGVKHTVSPWLTERLANSWVQSLSVDDHRKIRIKIPNAVRCQVVSQSLVKLAGFDIEVRGNTLRWLPDLKVLVADDWDWINMIIPSHGGCDLDDFFVARWVTDNGRKQILITRSPNARGEYSFFDYVPGDWHPVSTNRHGEEISFPPLTLKKRPQQILDAIEDGNVIYMSLPSEINPKPSGELVAYGRNMVIKDLAAAMSVDGGYGQYELVVSAQNSLHRTAMNRTQIPSEKAVDAFTQCGTAEDRAFILEDRLRILREIKASGKAVDRSLATRLGDRKIPSTTNGPMSKIKQIMQAEVAIYQRQVREYCSSLEIPSWLVELGQNHFSAYAAHLLRYSRRAMFQTDQIVQSLDQDERVRIIRGTQEQIFAPFFEENKDPHVRALFVMAFWYACRIVPTTNGKFTDQPVFGTNLFPHLLDALIHFGLARRPYVDDRGRVVREAKVFYQGDKHWIVICDSCKEQSVVGQNVLSLFWQKNGVCNKCR